MGQPVAVGVDGVAAPGLRRLVRGYHGSRFEGFTPGVHRGLPSGHLEFILCLDEPLRVGFGDASGSRPYAALVAGLHDRPVEVGHDGRMRNVSLELTPAGSRRLLGMPASEIANQIIDLDAVLGHAAEELTDRLASAPDWRSCCATLDQVLGHLARQQPVNQQVDDPAEQFWRRIIETNGTIPIADLAAGLGYSLRHLRTRFTREYGISPKQAARIVRFERASDLVANLGRRQRDRARPTLAEIATRCGYYDQAHLAREWVHLAGCPPSAWLVSEELPFVQDDEGI